MLTRLIPHAQVEKRSSRITLSQHHLDDIIYHHVYGSKCERDCACLHEEKNRPFLSAFAVNYEFGEAKEQEVSYSLQK